MDDLKSILDRIRKPLAFATKDNFAHIGSLASLEQFIVKQLADLKRIHASDEKILLLESIFHGFDSLGPSFLISQS